MKCEWNALFYGGGDGVVCLLSGGGDGALILQSGM